MRNNKTEHCKETGKYIYCSEAKATRALNRYDEIQRVYFCSSCDGFHSTSKTLEETLEFCELSCEEENKLLREKINRLTEDYSKVTRLEVINHKTLNREIGRLFNHKGEIEMSLQDNNKTLKIFI
jgi:hypothetical protein